MNETTTMMTKMLVIKRCVLARVNTEIYAQATLRASVSTCDYGIVAGEHRGRFKHPSLFAPSSGCTELARGTRNFAGVAGESLHAV